MKFIQDYKIYESLKFIENKLNESNIKFTKSPKKKGNKTDIFNVVKDGNIIGQVKWVSRLRSYGFTPTSECDNEIKQFIKKIMLKRKSEKN